MRLVLTLIALLAIVSPTLADDPGDSYAAIGISDPAHVTQFLVRLQQAVAASDRAAVVAMANYPLLVGGPGRAPSIYRDAAALRAGYARVFTPEVTAAIAAATPDNLFVRDQGVMIGNGQVWMRKIQGAIKIVTVNHTR